MTLDGVIKQLNRGDHDGVLDLGGWRIDCAEGSGAASLALQAPAAVLRNGTLRLPRNGSVRLDAGAALTLQNVLIEIYDTQLDEAARGGAPAAPAADDDADGGAALLCVGPSAQLKLAGVRIEGAAGVAVAVEREGWLEARDLAVKAAAGAAVLLVGGRAELSDFRAAACGAGVRCVRGGAAAGSGWTVVHAAHAAVDVGADSAVTVERVTVECAAAAAGFVVADGGALTASDGVCEGGPDTVGVRAAGGGSAVTLTRCQLVRHAQAVLLQDGATLCAEGCTVRRCGAPGAPPVASSLACWHGRVP